MFTSLAIFNTANRVRNAENNYKKVQLIRTKLRNKANILELPSAIFLKKFRLTKEAYVHVLRLLDLPSGTRSTRVAPILQLAATINLLGGGGYQRQVGADWAAPMVCRTLERQLTNKLNKMTFHSWQNSGEQTGLGGMYVG